MAARSRVALCGADSSNILETTLTTEHGIARLTESLNSGEAGRLPWSELARRIEGIEGEVVFDLIYHPGTRAGQITPWQSETPNGRVHHVGPVMTMLRLDEAAATISLCDDRGVHATFAIRAGDTQVVALLAAEELQLCLYGDIFEMASRFLDAGHILDQATARQLFELGNECADIWMRKDSGFWELEIHEHYTMSKVECWLALRRASELAKAGHLSTAMLHAGSASRHASWNGSTRNAGPRPNRRTRSTPAPKTWTPA